MERNKALKEEWITEFSQRFVREHPIERSEAVLTELLRVGLGNDRKVRNYLVVSDYATLLESTGSVMQAMYKLADKYNLSDRQIQNIIYNWKAQRKFKK